MSFWPCCCQLCINNLKNISYLNKMTSFGTNLMWILTSHPWKCYIPYLLFQYLPNDINIGGLSAVFQNYLNIANYDVISYINDVIMTSYSPFSCGTSTQKNHLGPYSHNTKQHAFSRKCTFFSPYYPTRWLSRRLNQFPFTWQIKQINAV